MGARPRVVMTTADDPDRYAAMLDNGRMPGPVYAEGQAGDDCRLVLDNPGRNARCSAPGWPGPW